ncbi:MAG TPA: hypothetical protein VMP11_15330 [Verrucomicrobiae bacterium]|nr:hypothetical protein [Verrucomicrobiae bacterium]
MLLSANAYALDNSWINSSNGKWEAPPNWSVGTPSSSESIYITNANAKTVTLDSTTAGVPNALTISNLTLFGTSGATNAVSVNFGNPATTLHVLNGFSLSSGGAIFITNSTLQADLYSSGTNRIDGLITVAANGTYLTTNGSAYVGSTNGGNGVVTILGGTLVVPSIIVGSATNGTGQVNVAGGIMLATNVSATIGLYGSGQISVSNGTFSTRTLTIGRNAGALGVYSGTAASTNNAGLLFVVGSGTGSTGRVWIAGGSVLTNTSGGATFGQSGVATLDASNSIVYLNGNITVGSGGGSCGTATFVGSTTTVNGSLAMGSSLAATGAVVVNGGTLTVTNAVSVGVLGTGSLSLSNATLRAASLNIALEFGGTLTMFSATAAVATNTIIGGFGGTGSVWMTGSTLVQTNATVFLGYTGFGQMALSNSSLLASNVMVGATALSQGTLTVAGGTSTVSSTLMIGNLSSNVGVGEMTIAGGVFAVTNATHTATLNVLNGTVSVNGGTLLVDTLVVTNNSGRFLHNGGTIIARTLVLDPNLSASGDALPNWWKQQYGLDPLSSNGVNGVDGDPDGDGLSNLQEYLMGTNPTNGSSAFRIISVTQTGNDILLTWTTHGGHANVVQAAPEPGGSYSTISPLITIPGSGDMTTNYLDVGGATNTPARFYRVALAQPAVDHFSVSSISGPLTSGVPVVVTITALDASNQVVTGFSGTAALSTTGSGGGVFIFPPTSPLFTSGQLTVPLTISAFGEATVAIVVTDGMGHFGQSNPFDVVRPASNFLIPVAGVPADIVPDSARGLLYMTVTNQVQRYDLINGVYLAPLTVGGNLRGIDISPDNNTLVVADSTFSGSSNWVYVVDLPSGASQQVNFPLSFYEAGTWAVAFGEDGAALITSEFQGSGWTPMRRYDPSTETYTVVASPRQHSMVSASGDGRTMAVAESNESPAPFDRYDVVTQAITASASAGSFLFDGAANRNGSQFAGLASTGAYLLNSTPSNFTQVVSVPTSIGVAYHPGADMIFLAVSSATYVLALETHTHAEIIRYDCGTLTFPSPNTFTVAFQQGRMRSSRDGNNLFVTVNGGVRWISRGTAPPADLGVSLAGSANPVRAGSNLTYTITVTNLGPYTVTDAKVFDTVPSGVSFLSASTSQGSYVLSNGVVIGSLGAMASGSVATVSVTVATSGQIIVTNLATAISSAGDPNLTNNTATLATSVQSSIPPLLTVTSPADGSYTTNSSITLAGTCLSPFGVASVTVNGNGASTANSYSNWSAVIGGLAVGTNTLTVTATDQYIPPDVATNVVHIIYATGSYDGNGDGLPDAWQLQYFGCVTCASAAPGNDADGDGMSNLEEFLAGTDPTNGAASFRITNIVDDGEDILITWTMGAGRTNALQAATGDYDTNNYADIFIVTNTVGSVTNYLDAGAATNSSSRFYRVRLVP